MKFNPNPLNPLVNKRDFENLGRDYGRDLYPKLCTDDTTLIRFGMTPYPIIKDAEKFITQTVAKHMSKKLPGNFDSEVLADNVNKELINTFTHGVVLGLMDAATDKGEMIA